MSKLAPKPKEKPPANVSPAERASLLKLSNEIALDQAALKEKAAAFEVRLAKAIASLGKPIVGAGLCLTCGYPTGLQQPCLRCNPPKAAPQG